MCKSLGHIFSDETRVNRVATSPALCQVEQVLPLFCYRMSRVKMACTFRLLEMLHAVVFHGIKPWWLKSR